MEFTMTSTETTSTTTTTTPPTTTTTTTTSTTTTTTTKVSTRQQTNNCCELIILLQKNRKQQFSREQKRRIRQCRKKKVNCNTTKVFIHLFDFQDFLFREYETVRKLTRVQKFWKISVIEKYLKTRGNQRFRFLK